MTLDVTRANVADSDLCEHRLSFAGRTENPHLALATHGGA